jgi:catenin alpha
MTKKRISFFIRIVLCLGVDRTAGAIRGRSIRVIDVVSSEMEKYEPGEYTEGVMESIRVLRDQSNATILMKMKKKNTNI